MKFVKSFLTILVASSTLALTIPTKKEESLDMECQQALTKYSLENQECKNEISSIKNEDELKKYCEKMRTDKCQKFYTTSFTTIPECKKSNQAQLVLLDVMTKQGLKQINKGCATDEQGNFCPLTRVESYKRINNTMTEQQKKDTFEIAAKDTCKSQKCTDMYISSIEDLESFNNELIETLSKIEEYPKDQLEYMKKDFQEDMKKIKEDPTISKTLAYLKSAECAAQAKSNSAEAKTDGTTEEGKSDGKSDDDKSGAVTSKTFSSVLFVALALLMYTL